jgi:8-oxo-dGTP diphosphatase
MFESQAPYIASFVILRKDRRIALIKRQNTGWMDGHWSLPAGKVEKNEAFTAAAIREASEEVGVMVAKSDMIYAHTMHRHADDSDWVDVYFEVSQWQGEVINAEPKVHSKVQWFNLDNLPGNIIPPVGQALKNIEQGLVYSEWGWQEQNSES